MIRIASLLSTVVLVGIVLLACGYEPQLGKARPKQEDDDFIKQLEQAGFDLSLPHQMRHVLAVHDDDARDVIEAILREDGYVATSERAEDRAWRVTAWRKEMITERTVFDARREMSQLIGDLGGEYVSLEVRE